jgi:tetratricopeptide (TPR) repeat protein
MRNTNPHELTRIFTKKSVGMFFFVTMASLVCRAAVPTSQESVDSLRQTLAMQYDNPNAHLALARRLNEQGNGLTAFLICERVRTLFGDDAFHAAFDIVLRDQVTDVLFHARKQVLQAGLDLDPKNVPLLKEMAVLHEAHGEPDDAAWWWGRAHWFAQDDASLIKPLMRNLTLAGKDADAQRVLEDWCKDHPDTAAAWESRVKEQIAQNSDTASTLADQAIAKFPTDGELRLERAQIEEQQKPADAANDYTAAAQFARDSATVQSAAARFFLKVHHDPQRALKYYLATYFLNPDFNDWESVDQRVRDEADELAQAKVAGAKSSGEALADLLADPNPMVQTAAMDQLHAEVGDEVAEKLLALTISDSPEVRDAAIALLAAHPEALPSQTLLETIKDQDPWQRAAAAAILAGTLPPEALKQLSATLTDPSIYVRLTAASALLHEKTVGRGMVEGVIQNDRSEWLRNAIADLLKQQP